MSTDNAQTESFSEVLPQNMDHLGISSNSDAVPKNDATAASVNHSVQDIANTSESMFAHPPLVPEYVHSGSVQIPSSVVLKVCPSDSDDEYATVSDEVSHTQTPDNTQETDTDKDLTTLDGNKAPFAEIPSPTFSEQYGSFTPTCTFGEYIDIPDSPYTPAPEDVMHIAQLTSPIPGGKSFTDPGSINTARKCRPQPLFKER